MSSSLSQTLTMQNSKGIGKPNEDYLITDDQRQVYILLDGVSRDRVNGVYPDPSPSRQVSELFAAKAYRYIVERLDEGRDMQALLRQAAQEGNRAVGEENSRDYGPGDFLPGTVGILACIRDGALHYAYNGDCSGVLVGDHILTFTESQTRNVAARKGEFTAFQIRNEICNNSAHPCAYGVYNGDARAVELVRTGSISLKGFSRAVLHTDGFEGTISPLSVAQLLALTPQEAEAASIGEGNADDRTVIIIDIKV